MARLGLDTRDFKTGLAEATSVTGKFSSAMLGIPGLGGALSAAGIGAAVVKITNYAEQVQHLSDRFGVSTTVIQQWGRAAAENGSSMEAVAVAFNKLEVARSKAQAGDEQMLTHFGKLGISINDIVQLKPDEIMRKLGASSGDAASMVALLGRNGTELRPIMQGIADDTIKFQTYINEVDTKKLAEVDRLLKSIYASSGVAVASEVLAPILRGWMKLVQDGKDVLKINQQLGNAMVETGKAVFSGGWGKVGDLWKQLGKTTWQEGIVGVTAKEAIQKPRGPRGEEDAAGASAVQDKIDKEKTVVAILTLQLGHQDALAAALKTELEFQDKINKAKEAGLGAVARELVMERDITLALQVRDIAQKNREKLQLPLADLAKEGRDRAPGDDSRAGAGLLARRALEEEALARKATLAEDLPGAQMHRARAEDIKSGIDTLKDSEKDLAGAFKMGIDAAQITQTLKSIEANTRDATGNL